MTIRATEHQPILVAHGTRSSRGVNTVAQLADLVRHRIGPTRVAFVDVLGPSPRELLEQTPGPALVIPAFLAAGYHVRSDIPEHIAASGHPQVTLCANLGPDPVLATVLRDRLCAAGWRPGDAVVLAAAGSSDPFALADALVLLPNRRSARGLIDAFAQLVMDIPKRRWRAIFKP